MSTTCRFFSPAASRMDETALTVSSLHTIADVMDCDTCWNRALGAREDAPVPCFQQDTMQECSGYVPDSLRITRRMRLDRGETPETVSRYIFVDVVEGRYGYGQKLIFVQKVETNSPENVIDLDHNNIAILFRDVIADNSTEVQDAATLTLETQCAEQPYEDLPCPAFPTYLTSYYATVVDHDSVMTPA